MNTDSWVANACVGWLCCGWPFVVGFVSFNVGRHGLAGWLRLLITRAKASLPPERIKADDRL